MTKFEQTLSQNGLTVQSVSKGIQNSIQEYKEAETEVNGLKEDFLSADEESKQDLQAELDEYVKLLVEADNNITKKINDYISKKPYYDAKLQHMRDKAAGKEAGASPKKNSFVGVGTTPLSGTMNSPSLAFEVEPTKIASEGVLVEPKKKDNWVLWGFLGLVGILVGVNVIKNRD